MTAPTTTGTHTSVWKVDPAHTLVEFSAKHMMFTTVKGQFKKVDAEIDWDGEDVTRSSVTATIDTSSLVTGDAKRDDHLHSPDFLHVENYPVITYKSRRVEPKGDNSYHVIGDLTIRDVTREVALDTTYEGRGRSPWGSEVASFSAITSINRKEFGLTWNVALETGGVLVGDTIKIELHIELVKQSGETPA